MEVVSTMNNNNTNYSLCDLCMHKKDIFTRRSHFILCTLHIQHEDMPKYPNQPVTLCNKYTNMPHADFPESDNYDQENPIN